jgi:ornithine cyclodeaminase
MFSVITGPTASRLIYGDVEGCIDVVRHAYLAHAHGQTVNPPSSFLRFPARPNARIIALPSHIEEPWRVSGIKWIASYPANVRAGMPRASAVLILNDAENGFPFACLEGSIVSAARTAASAVLAADLLTASGRRAESLAIIGAGVVARHVYRVLVGAGWTIERVQIYDIDRARSEHTACACDAKRHQSVIVAPDLATAVRASDLIVFATVAAKPHVFDPGLFDHRPVVLHVSLRDLAPELLLDAVNIVDDVDHVMREETSPHLAEQLHGSRDFVAGTLADVIEGRCVVDCRRTIVFSPFGLGVLDLSLGKWVYDRAATVGELVGVPDFFPESDA